MRDLRITLENPSRYLLAKYQERRRIYSDELPLNNRILDPLGTVTLSNMSRDHLILFGDLEIRSGTFDQNDQIITFNGDPHYWTDDVGTLFDTIDLAPDAVVILMSDITIDPNDNLAMQAGSTLYLNGFTLSAEGQAYSGIGQWPMDSGTIIGEIPEPATVLMLGTGIIGTLGYIHRRRKK